MRRSITALFAAVGFALASLSTGVSARADELRLLSDVRQLTFEGKRAGEGYFSADGSKMIFQSEREPGNPFYQIYLMDLETGDVERLSPGHGRTTCAWIHPSGVKALYSSTHDDPDARKKMQDELAQRESGGRRRRYAWSYDAAYEIYAQDLATDARTNLTNARGYDAEGSYSPDGRLIAFASNRRAYEGTMTAAEQKAFEHDKAFMMDIYLMNADGTGVRQITSAPGYDGGPFFSADGRQITWRRFSENGASAEIYVMDVPKAGEAPVERRLTDDGHMSWAPYFHPSGDYLIYSSNQEGFANFELFIVDAQGRGEPKRVTFTDGFDGLPVFHPDGDMLSWTSKRGGSSQIFMARWDDAEARRLLGLVETETAAVETAPDMARTNSAIRAEDARLHVERLASDEMQGRLTGTEGERRATDYVAAVFEKLGLEPAGDGGTYFQNFPFTAGVKLGGDNSLDLSGAGDRPAPYLDRDWRPLAFSRTGAVEAAGVVFAGYGIVAPGARNIPAYDSYGELDVTGKWVLALRFQPENVPPEWRRHLVRYSDLAAKASTAKRKGAAGLIIVTGPKAQARDRLVKLGFDAAAGGGTLAGLSISDDLGAVLFADTGKDLGELQEILDKGEAAPGFELPGARIGARIDIVKEKREGRNVLARLGTGTVPGTPPVIIGAHVDHLGHGEVSGSLATEEERGRIHFGADDNASGVAAMLEAAQYLVGLHAKGKLGAKRDVLFAAWSGEELGTLGSLHFTENMGDRGAAAYLNLDMVGHLDDRLYLQGAASSPAWKREIERRNVPVGLPLAVQDDPYLPTDSTPFYMQGVPVLNAFTGAHEDYSTPRDTAGGLNYEGIRDTARLIAGIARSLARAEAAPAYVSVARKKGSVGRKHLRAYLGTIPAYGQDESVKGVKLQGAVKGGPAEKAGIQKGDILVGLAGVEIETIHDFMTGLAGLKAGEATEMTVMRGGGRVTLTVVPGTRE